MPCISGMFRSRTISAPERELLDRLEPAGRLGEPPDADIPEGGDHHATHGRRVVHDQGALHGANPHYRSIARLGE